MSYVTQKGPDGTTWITVEPLMNDLKQAVVTLMELELPLDEEQGRNEKLLGLKATYEILGSILQEVQLKELRDGKTLN